MNTIAQKNTFLQVLSSIKCHKHIKLLNFLLYLDQKYKTVCISQCALAAHIEVHRQHVNALLKRFSELGLIEKIYRHRKTSIYKMSSLFKIFSTKIYQTFWSLRGVAIKALQKLWRQDRTPRLVSLYKYPVDIVNLHEKEGRPKRKRMEKLEISETLREVTKTLNLTKWGQIKLICFPDEVLRHGLDNYKKFARNSPKPFEWFFMHCKTHCEGNEIPISWQDYYDLVDVYHMPKNAPMIRKEKKSSFDIPKTKNLDDYFTRQKEERRERWQQLEEDKKKVLEDSQKNIYLAQFPYPGDK